MCFEKPIIMPTSRGIMAIIFNGSVILFLFQIVALLTIFVCYDCMGISEPRLVN
ncbi:hypothetical protein LINPERHAP2_LOCUS34060 [Linum perenne]